MSDFSVTFLSEAKRLASLGYAVFQCTPKEKTPFAPTAPRGCLSATTDFSLIQQWWSTYPNCNIGIKCENILVFDLDCKAGINGADDLANIVKAVGKLPESPLARTGSGGWHLFFARPKADIIGSKKIKWQGVKTGIDLQTGNQYIVAPPSLHPNGKRYQWEVPLCNVNELPPLPPQWIEQVLPKRNNTVTKSPPPVFTPQPAIPPPSDLVNRCRAYVTTMPPAVQGQSGHSDLLRVANVIFHGFGLSEPDGWQLMLEYNARCLPPWDLSNPHDEKEFRRKIRQAIENPINNQPFGYLREQGYSVTPQTDVSALVQNLNTFDNEEQEENNIIPEVPPLPDELLRVPGFIGEVMDFCLKNASYPAPAMAFGGALILQSFLCGRKVTEPGDLRTNLYLLALANASSGKDYARKVIKAVARQIGQSRNIGDKFSSGQAIEDSLLLTPNLLFLSDEFDAILNSIKKGKDTNNDMVVSTLLTLYTTSNSFYDRRRKANIKSVEQIAQPHLSIYGTATPKNYYSALNGQMLEGGLFARMIILDAGKRPAGQDGYPADTILQNERIIKTAQWWADFKPDGNLSDINPCPALVPFDNTAHDMIRWYRRMTEREYSHAEEQGDGIAMAVWGRATENATKLALLAACSERHQEPVILPHHTDWAIQFNSHQVRRALFLASIYASETEFDGKLKKAIQEIRKHGIDKLMPEWKLKRKLGLSPNEFDSVVSELIRRRLAVFETQNTRGRPQCGFRLL